MRRYGTCVLWTTLALGGSVAGLAHEEPGEEQPKLGWFDEAELSIVTTGGNAESETVAVRNTLRRLWEGATFRLRAGALRAESTAVRRFAVRSGPGAPQPAEESTTTLNAERYFLDARYDRDINERLFWFAGGGWSRNEPAGIRSRSRAVAGLGTTWFDDEDARFQTDYGLTFTDEETVSRTSDSFAGLGLSWEYWRRIRSGVTYGNDLGVDVNLDDTSDLRLGMVNALSVQLSESISLKVSHELQFDNQPTLIEVPVLTPGGAVLPETVLVEADDVDTILSVALVVAF